MNITGPLREILLPSPNPLIFSVIRISILGMLSCGLQVDWASIMNGPPSLSLPAPFDLLLFSAAFAGPFAAIRPTDSSEASAD